MSNFEKTYPESFYRGITVSNMINLEYKRVLGDVFRFDGNHKNENGYDEISINWNDDSNSLENIKNQKKDESTVLKYANGIVQVPTKKIKEMRNRYQEDFSYERKPIENNEYHGNILLNFDKIQKQWRKVISDELAMNVESIYTYNEESNNWTEYRTEI
jgi:hypothetical protein